MKTEHLRELFEIHNRIEIAFFELYRHYNNTELNKKININDNFYADLENKFYELNEARLEILYFTYRHIGYPVP